MHANEIYARIRWNADFQATETRRLVRATVDDIISQLVLKTEVGPHDFHASEFRSFTPTEDVVTELAQMGLVVSIRRSHSGLHSVLEITVPEPKAEETK